MSNNIKKFFLDRVKDLRKDDNCKNRNIDDALISIRFTDGHVHHLLPFAKEHTRELIEDVNASTGIIKPATSEEIQIKKPIIFKNRQAIGDILMFTAGVRDFKIAFPDWPISVQSTAMHIWDNNPYIDRSLNSNNAEIVEIGPSALTNASNRDDRHFANAFRVSIQEKLGVEYSQGPIKPDIWMTKEEVKTPIVEPPYWIIVAGEKGDWTAKTYPFERWEEIIANFPGVKFVQIGAKEHKHPKLVGDNVINMIGKTQDRNTGIRDLFRLFYFAEGSMGLVSFQMHLAAAFGMPCLVIAGAREPARFTRYPGHQYLCTDGCLPCAANKACWHCDLEKTCPTIIEKGDQRFPKCVDIIKTEDVIRSFEQFYEGGRLSFDSPRVPVLSNNLTQKMEMPMAPVVRSCKVDPDENVDPTKYGYEWGGACITDLDWAFIKKTLDDYKIQTILEFGPGLSSFLFVDEGKQVIAFETNPEWIKKLGEKGLDKKINLNQWNGRIIPNEGDIKEFDFALVDGPPGGKSRDVSIRIASERAKVVIIHDAGREWERKWQDEYLKDGFSGPIKGGHRCHLWVRNNEKVVEEQQTISPVVKGQKVFRLFCNSRGDGGCGRSIDYFMKAFVELGWRVEYVYSNPQPSGTHRRCGHKDVIVTNNLELLKAPCDVFLLASDDYVWEFKTDVVKEMFKGIQAKRKVMYINYKIGDIGTVPWTRGFDQYLFLNETLADAFTTNYMKAMGRDKPYSIKPIVLPPPADVLEHLRTDIDYSGEMKIVRHSSQGNAKYSKDINDKIEAILEKFPKATVRLMPGPSFIDNFDRVIIHPRNKPKVSEFLKLGNIYWYDLPEGYTEGGPRVILEALAAGLPVIASNSPGPQDRITKETGYLYNDFEEALPMFEKLNDSAVRGKMGKAAKEHAKEKFNPDQWIKHIMGEEK